MANGEGNKEKEVEKTWEVIKKQVGELKYGTVSITVHDGKITQVETSSKIRF